MDGCLDKDLGQIPGAFLMSVLYIRVHEVGCPVQLFNLMSNGATKGFPFISDYMPMSDINAERFD